MKQQRNLTRILLALIAVSGFATSVAVQARQEKLPQPDFSAMEQWYEIVKWTHDDSLGKLKLVVKPKEDPPHTRRAFVVRYFDADGVDLLDYNGTQIVGLGYNTPAGQLERVEAGAPYESQIRKVKKIVVYRVQDDGSLVEPPANREKKTGNTSTVRTDENKPVAKSSEQGTNAAGCSFDEPPAVTANSQFSQQLIKRLLYERYAFEANTGGLTAPEKIGVTVVNIQTLPTYTNTVSVVPGRGAQRKQDGAPPNVTIYPFKAKYIICRKYSKETRRTQYESNFVSFKDRKGNWDCPVDGVPQTTELR